jgi:metal-responsive CopG/Arc/MetJ family transcriptional regulator
MNRPIRVSRKYVRRNRPPEPGTNIGVRLQHDALEQLDAWIARQDDALSRPEAIRRLLAKALGKK